MSDPAAAGAGGLLGAPGLTHGVFVPQGWKLEYAGWGAAEAWERSVELAVLAEDAGYDHLWVYDHVETVPRREPEHVFEAFTMLSALSQRTTRVGLGELVTCANYRNVGLLAKEAACLDVYSGGRMILGLGAGWFAEEYRSYGYEYRSDAKRLAFLEETAEVVRRFWEEETVTFKGEHLSFDGAFGDPKPLQEHPTLLIGGGGEKINLRIAARLADATNWQVGLDAFVRKSQALERHASEIGRSFEQIVRTHGPDCRIFDSDAECRKWCESDGGGNLWWREPADDYLANNLVGTVEQVVEKAQAFVDAGCRAFILWLRDYPSDETLKRWMSEVAPKLSA